MMDAKNLFMVKIHTESINLCFPNQFVYESVLWALASLWVFLCNYVLYSLGLILRYIFRFHVEDRKNEHLVSLVYSDETKRNQLEDSEIDGFSEELANLLFPSCESFHVSSEGETELSVLNEIDPDIPQDAKKREGETEGSVFMETDSDFHENVNKEHENETVSSVFREGDSASSNHQNVREREEVQEEEEELEGNILMDSDSATTTIKCQLVSEKDLMEKPTSVMAFTFKEFFAGTKFSDNAHFSTENISEEKFVEHNLQEGLVSQEEEKEDSLLKQRTFHCNAFGGSDSSDVDCLLYDDSLFPSNSGSESCEGFDSERVEDRVETQFSCDRQVSITLANNEMEGYSCQENSLEKTRETTPEDKFDESDCDEDDEDDLEWENDELLEQLQLELRNARQGGLATILEEEEGGEETESPKVVEDLKPLKFEEKIEYKDHFVEIQKVYRSYAEKIRKLDVLNYQTLHAIGLLQLKDPLKLMIMPKSTVDGAKPQRSHNLLPRKAPKHISDPMHKFVEELHRELELNYVGQVCLSWEILCWQHKKAQELQQYDSQWPHRYNIVAGEFQLFQVLMQRFIEDEPFQGPRIHNYVKTRCVIRNLIQVPQIKDDSTKDKKKFKWDEEDAIASAGLVQIIKESMWVFWEFVRADKDYYGNVIFKVSNQNGNYVMDPEISDLLRDIRAQLQKKERKLKDIVRSGNCIVKKFQKHHEDHQVQLDHEQLLAQVGLRLISRVVNMKKLRKDQLIWCHEKLNRIKFVGRKIQVEPSFLLFPC